ncbi:hypothetical protein Ptr902_05218 [Pyrenophora tritici-repentis]|uniref:Uncharacterized protein n=1 Tax=Pyrenophora tritici-repentis TaxID=45151 RepID=A0A5M9LHU4_9PLEO|nr:hypothetical protein PtrV1_04370 [Pyrenophora tritici-repentis]KAF7452056.1 hypothetical protein A1F99_038330 [Pyrenophora tritici-repentis]KAF7574827.1 hypothetical protein PtrM4_064510 [Pyrenophora tritici-repentis]KAI2482901.1 hypothetical protein Ptr902_05218 [Pyrenophora tritici-repentis]
MALFVTLLATALPLACPPPKHANIAISPAYLSLNENPAHPTMW